ncbi:fatty acyl-AMP ligase [Lichenicola sp.]|uniref:fatty acyl-AMP ligase n=1 Tax=Lichenicola sp. TaxID=2804529 RepID=UPI003AFFA804
MSGSTATISGLIQRKGDFATLLDALEYAALGRSGLDFYSVRGELTKALPYAELAHDARLLAHRLLALGLVRGERVALIAETTPDFVRAFFACQYAGLIPAPLPLPVAFAGRDTYVSHVRRLVTEARASALLAPEALVGWIAPSAGDLDLRICGTIASLWDGVAPDQASAHSELPTIGPDDIAYLQFSSGSTRFPRGVVVHQNALMANAAGILTHGLDIRPEDRAVSWLPLYHDMGLVGFLLAPMAGQVSVDLLATQDFVRRPQLWLSLISRGRGTISYSPSFGYDLCARRERPAEDSELDLSCWRIAGIGGDMIRPGVLTGFAEMFAARGFRPEAFLPSYGMAEATLAISFAPIDRGFETDLVDLDRLEADGVAAAPVQPDARVRELVLCGRAIPGHEIEIRDDLGARLPDRTVGRVFARGPSLMRGYDGRPDETASVLSPDGWLDTGDVGYWLDGMLVVAGRAKDLIIINGRNIWPQDIEWTIEQTVPQVRTGNVAAFSVEEDGREVLILAVAARNVSDPAGLERVIADIGDNVRVQHGLDGRVMLLPPGALPYTSSGKLSRSATRQLYLAGTLPTASVPDAPALA